MSIKFKEIRPFSSMEEFAPSRDRWIVARGTSVRYRVSEYAEGCVFVNNVPLGYEDLMRKYTFEDTGMPAGFVELEVR